MTTNRQDVYTTVTQAIIEALEAGAGDWSKPWLSVEAGAPLNVVSRKPYRGVNTLILMLVTKAKGYHLPVWATYKQWADLGAQVRKGEKSTSIVFWKFYDEAGADDGAEGGEGDEDGKPRRVVARSYQVFNAAQVDGWTGADEFAPSLPAAKHERIQQADAFFLALGSDIRHGGNRAFFRLDTDHIQMPDFAAFYEPEAYYATLAHEHIHWTGASKRCNRDMSGRFGTEGYAMEELVAELGAAFLCADLGLTPEPRQDHAAYIASWLKVLKADNRAIFTAASKAQQACDWIHTNPKQMLMQAA